MNNAYVINLVRPLKHGVLRASRLTNTLRSGDRGTRRAWELHAPCQPCLALSSTPTGLLLNCLLSNKSENTHKMFPRVLRLILMNY